MPTNKYNQSVELLKKILNNGHEDVGMPKLRGNIIRYIGGDERTIVSTVKMMLETGLIKDIGMSRFKINGNNTESQS